MKLLQEQVTHYTIETRCTTKIYLLCTVIEQIRIRYAQKIINLTRVEVFERVRDIIYRENKLYMFLEDTASIGVIDVLQFQDISN